MIIISDTAAELILEEIFINAPEAFTMELFTGDYTTKQLEGSLISSFASGWNYSSKTLSQNTFTVSNIAGIATLSYPKQTWTFTDALTGNSRIYGYAVYGYTGTLMFAEKSTSFTPAVNDDKYEVTLQFQLGKGTPT